MRKSIEVVRRRQKDGTLMNEQKKITQETIDELGKVGYWGLLVEPQYGGSGTPFGAFARFLVKMGTVEPTIAGLASVHGCIGAVDPLRTFGSPEQKQEHLPKLASGERVSAFALTEPAAGSDLTALRTKAELVGDNYIVNGEKLFITNAVPGRTVGLVCLIENKPAVLIVDLPEQENETFQIKKYGLHALKHSYNQGLIFKNFKVPKRNRLVATRRRRPDGGLPRPQPRPRCRLRDGCRLDAADDGEHAALGRATARRTARISPSGNSSVAASAAWRALSSAATRSSIGARGSWMKATAAKWNARSPRSSAASRRKRR